MQYKVIVFSPILQASLVNSCRSTEQTAGGLIHSFILFNVSSDSYALPNTWSDSDVILSTLVTAAMSEVVRQCNVAKLLEPMIATCCVWNYTSREIHFVCEYTWQNFPISAF